MSNLRGVIAVTLAAVALACSAGLGSPADGLVPLGTWGGNGAGVIVQDTSMHVHIGCTFGDVSGRVPLNNGAFDVNGSYLLRAYPITVGPTVPARFTGTVVGKNMTITVTVNDTVAHQTVVKGPVVVTLGATPQLGPCPICRR